MTLSFDLDGTLNQFYNVPNWLEMLRAEEVTPYLVAKPLFPMITLAKYLNAIQQAGHKIAVISWCSKGGTNDYNARVAEAKKEWLREQLPTVQWDRIIIVPYGTPKELWCESENDILFDDEERNRNNWNGKAYAPMEIGYILRKILGR